MAEAEQNQIYYLHYKIDNQINKAESEPILRKFFNEQKREDEEEVVMDDAFWKERDWDDNAAYEKDAYLGAYKEQSISKARGVAGNVAAQGLGDGL